MQKRSRNRAQTKAFRRILFEKRSELLATPGPPTHRGDLEEPTDEGEQATASHEEYIAQSLSNRARQELRLVEGALHRLKTGNYGICLECGEPIASQRLQALPWAEFCVSCQERQGAVPPNDEGGRRSENRTG